MPRKLRKLTLHTVGMGRRGCGVRVAMYDSHNFSNILSSSKLLSANPEMLRRLGVRVFALNVHLSTITLDNKSAGLIWIAFSCVGLSIL